MRIISLAISTILHPVFVPIIGFYCINIWGGYSSYLSPELFRFTAFSIILFTILIPISSVLLLQRFGKVSSIQLERREERPLPLIIGLISGIVLLLLQRKLFYPPIYNAFFVVIAVSYFFSFVASFINKISLHAIAWGTLIGVFIGFGFRLGIPLHLPLSILILISSVVVSSRLYLNAHSLSQVLSGWGVSMLLAWLVMLLF